MPNCHENGVGNPSFVLIVTALCCSAEFVSTLSTCRFTSLEEMLVTLEEIYLRSRQRSRCSL